ncbi:MAG: biotin-dependent carboxyltransferase family protein [Bacteroidetes bacterium]|nr:biotin-dependent carboxyltransferase family protein [Bacteroidota bacterium]MBS1609953.1 biotin-dependent carboxyltransferase family protein [Bacteroidota bacterium]
MSLTVIKPGILDTLQDGGRFGYQYLGVNRGGVMDLFSAQVVNMLVGNETNEAVIEMHFPAAAYLFQQETIIAVGGADFVPCINGEEIPLWHPVIISRNSILQFQNIKRGAQCYLAVRGGFDAPRWLDSYSTNLKAVAGGIQGRALQKDDIVKLKKPECCSQFFSEREFVVLPWHADVKWNELATGKIAIVEGHEWNWLKNASKSDFLNASFAITTSSDRMGYRLSGPPLYSPDKPELISSAVSFGTIQLLPDGQMIVLMADHQTAGGYPRIAHVITAHLSQLAQLRPGEKVQFYLADLALAENLYCRQQQHLLQLKNACKFRLEEFLKS